MIRTSSACCTLLLILSAWNVAQAPKITKVEPPNWWIGLPNPMIMLTGENLDHARVSSVAPGIRVRRIMNGRNGHYLFAWIEIGKQVSPGEIPLTIATAKGKAKAEWKLERRNPAGLQPAPDQGFNGFGPDDVIYLIMPDRFADGDPDNNFPASGTYDRSAPRAYHGGDLRGIQQHLPYLKDLGVTTLWITPIYNNDDHTGRDYHGYGAVDLYSTEEHFGTVAEYQSLVKAAHDLGLKVILDIVPNHVGPTNPWADDPPTDHWLHGTRARHLSAEGKFQRLADPHASPGERRSIVEGWFANILPDMGTDDPVTSQFLRQNAIWWVEKGALDGLRLDTFPFVDRQFWHDFHYQLHYLYPRFKTVGEVYQPDLDPATVSYFAGGKTTAEIDTGVDTLIDAPLYSALRRVILHDASAALLEQVLQYDWLYPHPDSMVTFLGNHDTPRFMGERGATPQQLELAFAFLFTVRGIPQIYYGDEIGMPGGGDPDNRRDFPGGFPDDSRNAFTGQGLAADEKQILAYVRKFLHLRQQHPALRRGSYVHIYNDEQTLAYVRDFQSERLLLILNNAGNDRTVEIPVADTLLTKSKALTKVTVEGNVMADHDAELLPGRRIRVELPGKSLSIYQVE